MDNFIVSARKYRPASFDMVVGQASITNTLKSAIKNNKLAHAYLFCGPRGVGKTTCARIFAKTINCSNITADFEACDNCESCKSFNSLRSFNIHELDAASNNKVEDIRSLNDQVRIPPQVGKYSVYIIDEVHMLSSSAFNAFLKTLEEPPAHAIFILATTEKHKIIPTILSRCQIFDFNRIKIEDIVSRLMFVARQEGIDAAEEALHVIAQKADGAMRDALSIFDQIASLCDRKIAYNDVIENLNVLDYEYYFRLVDAALMGDVSSVLLTFNEVLEKGFDGHNFISGLNSHLRDLLVSRDEVTLRLLEASPVVKQRYLQQTGRCTPDFLFRALETGNNCDLNYRNSKNPRLIVELALIKLCRLQNGNGTEPEKKKPDNVGLPENHQKVAQKDTVSPSVAKEAGKKIDPVNPENEHSSRESSPDAVAPHATHEPKIERPVKSFSIKNLLNDNPVVEVKKDKSVTEQVTSETNDSRADFNADAFAEAWNDFVEQLEGEGTRIVSMFKSVKPEIEDDNTIRIHLHNATQKDTFVLNYKQRLISFLESRFKVPNLDILTAVDQTEEEEILYTDEQKQNYLFGKYPGLKDMKKLFNLDIP
ncbi:MAG TPA: DNA polymerase III subunit gamma/tau [Bacteroidales bacterium]|nr:DNA polymerase III subunit gamma/tau [Bacteroidales bacterium]